MELVLFLKLLLGLVVGYILGSYIESLFHQYISDAPKKFYRFYKRYPTIFSAFLTTYFSHHVVHHHWTYKKNHSTQFCTDAEKKQVALKLEAKGKHGKTIVDSDFALKLGGVGITKYLVSLSFMLPVLYWLLDVSVFFGACISIWLPAIMAHWIHPYLHMKQEEMERIAPKFIYQLMQTRYMQWVVINHFIHHKYGGKSNFNLVLGADILRRVWRKPNIEDYLEMRAAGLIS